MTASFADNEIWHVLMDGNDMKRLNVEQLDDAFRLSLVDASAVPNLLQQTIQRGVAAHGRKIREFQL